MVVGGAWAFGWDAIVALSTLGLAAMTYRLANRTSALASETTELAKFTQQGVALTSTAIAADVRPVLIAVLPKQFVRDSNYETRVPGIGLVRGSPDRSTVYVQTVEGDRLFVSVPFRNAGVGIAFVSPSPTLEVQGRRVTAGGEATLRQVPPGEFTRVSFGIEAGGDRPTLEMFHPDGFAVEATYTDLAGNRWVSRLVWEPDGNDWALSSFDVQADRHVESVAS